MTLVPRNILEEVRGCVVYELLALAKKCRTEGERVASYDPQQCAGLLKAAAYADKRREEISRGE